MLFLRKRMVAPVSQIRFHHDQIFCESIHSYLHQFGDVRASSGLRYTIYDFPDSSAQPRKNPCMTSECYKASLVASFSMKSFSNFVKPIWILNRTNICWKIKKNSWFFHAPVTLQWIACSCSKRQNSSKYNPLVKRWQVLLQPRRE